jgi:hypothetical protein
MTGRMRWSLATVTLILSLLVPGAAFAEHAYDDCPRPCYSCKHYWAPQLWRIHSCLFCPKMNTYAPDRHPEIEPTFKALRWHCPPVPPQQSSVEFYWMGRGQQAP